MIPLPVALASVILIGWPALKLAATLISRPIWKRARGLAAQIKADSRYGAAEIEIVDNQLKLAKGEPLQILMPVLALTGGFALSFDHFSAGRQAKAITEEVTIEELKRQLAELEIRVANLGLRKSLSPEAGLWTDRRFERLEDIAFWLALLRYPVALILTGIALAIVAPFIIAAEGLRASSKLVILKLVRSSAYFSRVFAISVGAIS